MFKLALILAVVALAAAILGFGGIAGAFADLALIVFVAALVLAALFLILGWMGAKRLTQ